MATVAGSAGCASRNVPARPASSPSAENQRPHASALIARPPARKARRVEREATEEEHQPLHAPRDHEVVPAKGDRGRQRQEGERDRAVEPGHPAGRPALRAATRAATR